MSEITVSDFDDLINQIFDKEKEIDEQKKVLTVLNKEYASLRAKAAEFLLSTERSEYDTPRGKLKVLERSYAKLPNDPEDRKMLFDWMKSTGVYEGMITINASKFNAFYQEERKNCNDIIFNMPGVENPPPFSDLRVTKKRN